MGFVLSCCRRRKIRKDDEEARPLLRDGPESSDQARLLARLANIVGALKAGKLPSQEQINHAVRLLLASDTLKPTIATATATLQNYELSEPAARVLLCIRQVLEMVAQVGLEKNGTSRLPEIVALMLLNLRIDDDLVQELLYTVSRATHRPDQLAASVHIGREDGRAPGKLLHVSVSSTTLKYAIVRLARRCPFSSGGRRRHIFPSGVIR